MEYACHNYPPPPPYSGGFARTDWCKTSTCRDGYGAHPAALTTDYRDLAYWVAEAQAANGSARWQRNGSAGGGQCSVQWSEEWANPFYECFSDAPFYAQRVQGWFDDARSTRLKVELARSLGLGGWGVFAADQIGSGGGTAAMWSAISK